MTKQVIITGFILIGLATVFGQSQQVKTAEAHAELPNSPEHSPRFEKIATGFDLYAILQDRDGFWWLATQSGLVKYNGYDFHRYSAGEHSITGNFVTALTRTVRGSFGSARQAGSALIVLVPERPDANQSLGALLPKIYSVVCIPH